MSAGAHRFERAAVVGAGTMGVGFSHVLALGGLEVALADADAATARDARSRSLAQAQSFERAGLLDPGAADLVAARVTAAASVADAAEPADLVLEAVTEDPDVKRRVLDAVEAAAGADCVIATNTSAIPIADLSSGRARPGRFLGAHWFNPPQWVPCVEVIAGPDTEPATVDALTVELERLGKRPVVVGDSAGFVANRIQFAMFKEAASVVADGVADAPAVDAVVRSSFGFRLPFFGPFAIADMNGLDVYAGAYAALEEGLGPRFEVPDAVRERVDDGRLGTKTGGGFLDITADATPELTATRDGALLALARLIAHRGVWDRA